MAFQSTQPTSPRTKAQWLKTLQRQWPIYALNLVLLVVLMLPFYWTIISSLKPEQDIVTYPPRFTPNPWTVTHYAKLLANADARIMVWNSLLVALGTVCLVSFCATMAGFAVAKIDFGGRKFLFALIIMAMLLPFQSIVVPLFLEMKFFRLINTRLADDPREPIYQKLYRVFDEHLATAPFNIANPGKDVAVAKNEAAKNIYWELRIRRNREVSIPAIYQLCQDTGRLSMLHKGWKPAPGQEAHFFWDSDVAKWLEAASYSLTTHPDSHLEHRVDEVIALFSALQQPDGYVNSYFINIAPEYRWKNLSFYHELYCAGHLIEAGVAHFQATGKTTLLNIVRRYADHIYDVFGPGKRVGIPGHQEIELALVKLFRATGDRRYLELSQLFLDRRGTTTVFKDEGQDLLPRVAQWYRQFYGAALPPTHQSLSEPRETPWDRQFHGEGNQFTTAYCQDHLPVRQQANAVGHAVRAMYMYSAMADVAYETGEPELLAVSRRLWENVCERQMYITGGIGPSRYRKGDTEDFEGFTEDYDLPNLTAYAETCASIGMVFWNHRMFHIEPQRRYMDILERELYNGAICGVALDGTHFFYENPLQSTGDHHRQTWYAVSCCPPNLARLLASLGQYIYSQAERDVFVNLYIQSDVHLDIGGQSVVLQQQTRYPWEETILLTVQTDQPTQFALHLRWPEWCRRAELTVNGEVVDVTIVMNANGYLYLDREWKSGDQIMLTLSMPVEHIESHPAVLDNIGCVALQRGPVIYCLEQCDHDVPLHQIVLPREAQFSVHFEPDLLHGMTVLNATGLAAQEREPSPLLCRHDPSLTYQPCQITAIPYYAWDNRQPGAMRVWIRSVL